MVGYVYLTFSHFFPYCCSIFNGKLCALCQCGERSLLGQGELTHYDPTPGYNVFKKGGGRAGPRGSLDGDEKGAAGDRNRQHLTWRRPRGPSAKQR